MNHGIILEIVYTVVVLLGGNDRLFIVGAQANELHVSLLNMAKRVLMSQGSGKWSCF